MSSGQRLCQDQEWEVPEDGEGGHRGQKGCSLYNQVQFSIKIVYVPMGLGILIMVLEETKNAF